MNTRIQIFDTTLRDGEQAAGCSMSVSEKLRMAHLLDELGVDVMEAGFPIASEADFESVCQIAQIVKHSAVAGDPVDCVGRTDRDGRKAADAAPVIPALSGNRGRDERQIVATGDGTGTA